MGIVALSPVNKAKIGQDLGDGWDHNCELRKGIRDVSATHPGEWRE
jgi:hypothetical protein